RELSDENMVRAIQFGQEQIKLVTDMISELRAQRGLPPPSWTEPPPSPLHEEFRKKYYNELAERKLTSGKHERADRVAELRDRIAAEYLPETGEPKYPAERVAEAFHHLEQHVVRELILQGKRVDGRNPKQLRNIDCEVSVLPRTHGSAIFTRGETQALVTTT